MRRVTHRMDWGVTPSGKRFASCTCGWRAPVRSKLTHGLSDVRDHLADVRARQRAAGLEWWMVKGGIVTEELDEGEELAELVQVAEDLRPEPVRPAVVRNPASVAPRSRAELAAAKAEKEARRRARRAARVAPIEQAPSQVQSSHRAAR